MSLGEFALSIPRRELDFIAKFPSEVQHHLELFDESQSVDECRALLAKVSSVLPTLLHNPEVIKESSPAMLHTDLHLGNIFVSRDYFYSRNYRLAIIPDCSSIHTSSFP
jgi:Phosphotransferase enzyme family.